MNKFTKAFVISICIVLFSAIIPALAADKNLDWEAQVKKADEAYWNDFNYSGSAALSFHFTSDIEFYHDLGGPTIGKDAMVKITAWMDNADNQKRTRRVLVPDTMRIYPMRKNDEIYGALVMGEHDFFTTESGKLEKKTVRSTFAHLLLLKDGSWRISRIYSYDHKMEADSAK